MNAVVDRAFGTLTACGETQAAQFSRWGLARRSIPAKQPVVEPTRRSPGSHHRLSIRTAIAALSFALTFGAGGCGRRGPPQAPLQVDPETPRLLPLRQESGQVVVRWYAPRLSSGGDVEELRLRKAIVSYRVVNVHGLAAEERASQRAGPEDEEEESEVTASEEEPPPGELAPVEASEPERSETEPGEEASSSPEGEPVEREPEPTEPEAEPAEPDAAPAEPEAEPTEPETEPTEPEVEPAEPEAEPTEPEAEPTEPEVEPATPEAEPADVPLPDPPPVPEVPEGPPAGEGDPPGQEPEGDQETPDDPDAAEPQEGEAPSEESDEPPAEPEPTGVLLDYDDLEFEVLSEVESEVLGEERFLELPVEPDWIGRRLEVRVRYEARGGASEESDPQSLDVTGPLPAVEGVSVDVGPRELTVRWPDPRAAPEEAPHLADPVFEVFRRRGAESERLGRSLGPTQTDSDVVWGEEVCYSARLVMAGSDDERVLPDPGPNAAEAPELDEGAGENPNPDEANETGSPGPPAEESGDPEGEAVLPPEESEPAAETWSPIPIRVPGAGSGALSVGPMSTEACVTPVDVFPPLPPSDLRLFWRAEQTELSWKESVSTDVVGYHVYRSGPDGTGFERLTRSLIGQTSFSDAARDPRGSYRYAITAVDGADPPNESLPSESRRVNPR